MRKAVAMLAMVMLVGAVSARSEAVEVKAPGGIAGYQENLPEDGDTEDSCACCQNCNAARRQTLPEAEKKKEKKELTNGCQECCERCGKVVPPAGEKTPPERIENEVPPELKDKPRPQE